MSSLPARAVHPKERMRRRAPLPSPSSTPSPLEPSLDLLRCASRVAPRFWNTAEQPSGDEMTSFLELSPVDRPLVYLRVLGL